MSLPLKKGSPGAATMRPPPRMLSGFKNINRYWDRYNLCYCAKILPGEYYVTNQSELIVTTLGSCIAACIRDRRHGIGGMNHFMLPTRAEHSTGWQHPSVSLANRYGSYAMENLINDILKNGGSRKNLEIKIFGGSKILAKMMDIGQKNIEFIENYIEAERLNLMAKDVGSIYPRKLIYNPITGNAKVKKLRAIQNDTIRERETRYLDDIQENPISGNIELFK